MQEELIKKSIEILYKYGDLLTIEILDNIQIDNSNYYKFLKESIDLLKGKIQSGECEDILKSIKPKFPPSRTDSGKYIYNEQLKRLIQRDLIECELDDKIDEIDNLKLRPNTHPVREKEYK